MNMKTSTLTAAIILIVLGASRPASAAPRIFVSGLGNDANPGSLTSPKRSFASAITVTDAWGEIVALDSAGYGPVTITKSISIIAQPGVHAGITVTSGDGITINAGQFDDVTLHGLTIEGAGGTNGIDFVAGSTLNVEDCVISGFASTNANGILVAASAGANAQLLVSDSICRGNYCGIQVQVGNTSSEAAGNASLDHVRLEKNAVYGLLVNAAGARVSIADSVSSENGNGMWDASGQLNVERCLVANNAAGIAAINSNATVRVSNSTITNSTGSGLFINSGATMQSRGNNTVRGNGTDVNGSLTSISGT
jgi:parallel beta helix pectate lyase-like protein